MCVQDDGLVESWAKYFSKAVVAEPREGRECDVVARAASALNADKVTLRSAYDGTVITEIEGPMELVPRLAALSLAPNSEAYLRLMAQRKKSGF